jgi:hypothetical protein
VHFYVGKDKTRRQKLLALLVHLSQQTGYTPSVLVFLSSKKAAPRQDCLKNARIKRGVIQLQGDALIGFTDIKITPFPYTGIVRRFSEITNDGLK